VTTAAAVHDVHRAEALRKALELLGANDEAAVLETLQQAADDYSAAVNVRVKDLTHKLDKIEQLSVELATALDSYDDTLLDGIGTRALWLDSPFMLERDWALVESLRELSEAAGRARGHMVASLGSGDPDAPDRGGTSLSTRCLGTRKRRFVGDLAYLWAAYRPDAVSAGEGSDFANFVDSIWEWATTDPPKGLADDIKVVVPPIRFRCALRDRAYQHDLVAHNLARIGCENHAEHYRRRANRIRRRTR